MNEPLGRLKAMVIELGSRKAVAEKLDISQSYLSDIMAGKRDISDVIAKKLGFKRSWVATVREDAPMAKDE